MEEMVLAAMPWEANFWKGKRVLVTGHTGFKGAWLTIWLERLGAEVTGVSLPPSTAPNLFGLARVEALCRSEYCDIRDAKTLARLVIKAKPDIVFHLAAQALVRAGYEDPLLTFTSNVMGTANLLDVLRSQDSVKVAVAITTDKVYQNKEWHWPYREDDALGGHDPYSASKAACEIIIDSYRKAFLAEQGIALASARAGNVIGGGDWSDDRLIPDAIRAWQAGKVLDIRRPEAIRPWQHVLEPLFGYLILAQRLWHDSTLAGAYNFGPRTHEAASVRYVIEQARVAFGVGSVSYGDGRDGPHEARWLALEVAKARQVLGIRSSMTLAMVIQRTMAWYKSLQQGRDARTLCDDDIIAFQALQDTSE